MVFFSILFAFVFLVGSDGTLPNVGSCTYKENFCSAQKCGTAFLKAFQKDPKADCGTIATTKLKNCLLAVMKVCMGDLLSESAIKQGLNATFMEKDFCEKGFLELEMPPNNAFCPASFNNDANTCVRSFRQKYIKDKSDPALCSGYAEAKKCLKNLIDSNCNYPPSGKEIFDMTLSVYNPFCSDNRDPGATGNNPCDGVPDKTGDGLKYFNAAAGIKPRVLQALLFACFLLLFFFKA